MMTNTKVFSMQLQVLSVDIRRDAQGRYSLNDLHKAAVSAGMADKHKTPSSFTRNDWVQELDQYLTATQICIAVKTHNGGPFHGTYAGELIATEYAAWLSTPFKAHVLSTFRDAQRGESRFLAAQVEALTHRIEDLENRQLQIVNTRPVMQDWLPSEMETFIGKVHESEWDTSIAMHRETMRMAAAEFMGEFLSDLRAAAANTAVKPDDLPQVIPEFVSVTALAREAQVGPPRMNVILEESGFQKRHGDIWVPTDRGQHYAKVVNVRQGRESQSTKLVWRPDTLKRINRKYFR